MVSISNVWQYSQKTVGCFPIMRNVLFQLLCPILSLVIPISSLIVPPQFLNVSTWFWMAYKCLPLAPLSHFRCHSLTASFQTIFFPSDFDVFIFTSIFSFVYVCLANIHSLIAPLTEVKICLLVTFSMWWINKPWPLIAPKCLHELGSKSVESHYIVPLLLYM